VRCGDDFKIFTNINSTIVDPKKFDEKSFVDFKGPVCIIPPNSFALAGTVGYFRIPRSVLTICVGKSTYARCFRGDTRVALVDGTAPTLEEMARRHDTGELFWGYSIGQNGRLIVSLRMRRASSAGIRCSKSNSTMVSESKRPPITFS
jgi:dCTP deaminase